MSTKSHSERMANIGEKITLRALGDITVKELSLEGTIAIASELLVVITSLDTSSGDSISWIKTAIADERVMISIRSVAAYSTGLEESEFENLGLTDWLKLMKAFRSVMDWEELRKLFMELIPKDFLEKLTEEGKKRSTSQDSSTDSSPSTSGPRLRRSATPITS